MFNLNSSFKRVALLWLPLSVPIAALWFFEFGHGPAIQNWALGAVTLLSIAGAMLASRSLLFFISGLKSRIDGIHHTRQVIEYTPDGVITWANDSFLTLFGYRLEDLVGRHHSIFVDSQYAKSDEYREFWARLGRGEYFEQRLKRKGAGGKDIFILANYTPVFDAFGRLRNVVNWTTDFTEAHREQEVVVESIAGGLKKLAAGDLTARIDVALQAEYDELRTNFNSALDRLSDTMKSVLSGASAISSGANEISQAADDLSKRTEQQAASLEQTAAALEEITSTVKKTASNTKEASSTAASARAAAEEGGRVVETAIKAMDSIAQSSKQITDIIGVIDEIAFQTNLLALNAGVEAARAGDAGKGFAVVASEVRALAQRSSEAAKEIKTLINASGEHVSGGVRFVGESGEALRRIVDQVGQINTLVSEMALAAEQQSSGIEQVNAAVGQMDQVTQQNAAMVEESTAASRNLASETQSLANLVRFFNVGVQRDAVAAEPAPASRQAVKTQGAATHPRSVKGRGAAAAVARKPNPEPESDDWAEF